MTGKVKQQEYLVVFLYLSLSGRKEKSQEDGRAKPYKSHFNLLLPDDPHKLKFANLIKQCQLSELKIPCNQVLSTALKSLRLGHK